MIACRRRGAFCKGITCTPARRGPTFVRAKVGKTRSRGTDSPLTNPFLSLAVLDTNLDFSGAKNPNPYCAQIRSQGSRRRICPHRLAVPEKIFALLACSIFSTATDAPPRCIRHWRRSAPHPTHRDPFPGPGLLGYPSYLLHRSVSSAVTSGRWAFRSHICKSGAICARQPAAARPGRLYISRSAGFASSSASVSSRAV